MTDDIEKPQISLETIGKIARATDLKIEIMANRLSAKRYHEIIQGLAEWIGKDPLMKTMLVGNDAGNDLCSMVTEALSLISVGLMKISDENGGMKFSFLLEAMTLPKQNWH